MLTNLADLCNLGDVLSGREDVFAMSHIANAFVSPPELQPLASRDRQDVYRLIRMAHGAGRAGAGERLPCSAWPRVTSWPCCP